MDTQKFKESLTVDQIVLLVTKGLGSGEPLWFEDHDQQGAPLAAPIFQTICHNPAGCGSYKLYYYPSSHKFYCWTHCQEDMDVFELVKRSRHFDSFMEAARFICQTLGIDPNGKEGFGNSDAEKSLGADWDLLSRMDSYAAAPAAAPAKPEIIPENILEFFPKGYPQEWLDDSITKETMDRYGIRIDPANQKIIIPHRNVAGELIGIRGRSYDPVEVAEGNKYMPVTVGGKLYRHRVGSALYGLWENKEAIMRCRHLVIYEAEKSVMQTAGYYNYTDANGVYHNFNHTVAICGSNLTQEQIDLILSMRVEEVTLALDKEGDDDMYSAKSVKYWNRLVDQIRPLTLYCRCYIVFDSERLLNPKDSPSDRGRAVLERLLATKTRILSYDGGLRKK